MVRGKDGAPKRARIQDVAKEAEVSIATVSNVFNRRPNVSQATRNRVLEAAMRLGYAPRNLGPSTRHRRKRIALIVEEQSREPQRDFFISEVVRGIEQAVQFREHSLEMYVIADRHAQSMSLPDAVLYREVRGVIVLEGGELSDQYVAMVQSTGLPVVLADNYLHREPAHCVTIDNVTAGYMVTRRLIELGHKRIGFIRGSLKYKPLVERFLGYVQALEEAGIPFVPELAPPRMKGGVYKGYYEMLHLLELPKPPTAVFAVSDKTAVNALKVAKSKGVRIPEDLSLFGFDNMPTSQEQDPPISTVWIPMVELGRVTAERLFNLIDYVHQSPVRILMPTRLIERASIGPPNDGGPDDDRDRV